MILNKTDQGGPWHSGQSIGFQRRSSAVRISAGDEKFFNFSDKILQENDLYCMIQMKQDDAFRRIKTPREGMALRKEKMVQRRQEMWNPASNRLNCERHLWSNMETKKEKKMCAFISDAGYH